MPTGIVLAAHGSRHPGAMAALAAFGARLSRELPDTQVEIARTVGRKHGGRHDFGGARRVADVLAALAGQGLRRVVVQSLHVVPGEEYHEMLSGLGRSLEGHDAGLTVSVGAPLLASLADVGRVAEAVLANLPAARRPGEAVVVMGHGAPPPGAGFYDALAEALGQRDPLAHFGTMPREKGAPCPDIGRIRDRLVRDGLGAAWLLPFFTVAGAHACCDLAGDGPASWRAVLEAAGIRCTSLLSGLIEQPAMTAIWREHLDAALARLP
ncbi:MAG: sirohydrochlorin cobaltochelatase [Solidesulfovibrio sp. DCME]|uniref:sirohydrochlorin cobaltochelatase n=1 Tax=Solidesulfovibrio sp. DCME TaxID=3447380 RepID=UPI003D0D07EC